MGACSSISISAVCICGLRGTRGGSGERLDTTLSVRNAPLTAVAESPPLLLEVRIGFEVEVVVPYCRVLYEETNDKSQGRSGMLGVNAAIAPASWSEISAFTNSSTPVNGMPDTKSPSFHPWSPRCLPTRPRTTSVAHPARRRSRGPSTARGGPYRPASP